MDLRVHSSGTDRAADSPQAADPIDRAHLHRYTLGDRALEAELLGLFSAQADVYLAALRSAPNMNAWREAAHTLKGSANGIGAFAVGKLATVAERLTGGPNDPEAASCLDAVEASVREVQSHIAALLVSAEAH